jgi:hypothetical protein
MASDTATSISCACTHPSTSHVDGVCTVPGCTCTSFATSDVAQVRADQVRYFPKLVALKAMTGGIKAETTGDMEVIEIDPVMEEATIRIGNRRFRVELKLLP